MPERYPAHPSHPAALPPVSPPPLEARLLARLDEPMAAGFYELRNASQIRRVGRGLKRYAESLDGLPPATATLYPSGPLNLWNLCGAAIGHSYTAAISINGWLLRDKIVRLLPEGREQSRHGR